MPVLSVVLSLGAEFCSFSLKVTTMDFPAGITKDAAVQFLSAKVDSNLTHILQKADVPIELQYNLCQSFKTVRRFSTYEDERAKVRDALKNDFHVDGATASPTELQSRLSSVPGRRASNSLSRSRSSRLRRGCSGCRDPSHKQIEQPCGLHLWQHIEPSDEYLSAKAEELESYEPSALPLNEVTSKRSTKTLGIQTSIDAGGQIRIIRNKQKGSLPQGTEELRTTLRIEANMWCFLAAKFRNRKMLRGMSPACWDDYVNFLLGDKCYLMKIHGGKGNEATPLRPPWRQIGPQSRSYVTIAPQVSNAPTLKIILQPKLQSSKESFHSRMPSCKLNQMHVEILPKKVTTDKLNLCIKCERCSLWIQQTDKQDYFDRLIQVPCLDHNPEPCSHWKCKGCDAQLCVRAPKLSQKLKMGCKPKSKCSWGEPHSKPVNLFFKPVIVCAAVSTRAQAKAKAKQKGLVQTKLNFNGQA